jgi:hypothetical protein
MNQINNIDIPEENATLWVTRNPSGKYEEIDPLLSELPIGAYVIRFSWSNNLQKFCTTAGSLYQMTPTGLTIDLD